MQNILAAERGFSGLIGGPGSGVLSLVSRFSCDYDFVSRIVFSWLVNINVA